MPLTRTHLLLLAAVAVAGAAYVVHARFSPTLAFEDRLYPPGFRELVLPRAVSAPNPMFGIERAGREVDRPDRKDICAALFRDVNLPEAGNPAGAVQFATFLDYRCPYCKTLSGIIAAMPDSNLRILFHEWAILGPASELAARAALAANAQGKYLPFHTRLMNARLLPTPGYIDALAGELGMDVKRLHADMASDSITRTLRRTARLATDLSFFGTPALVVGRTIVQGEITRSQLEGLIAQEAQARGPC